MLGKIVTIFGKNILTETNRRFSAYKKNNINTKKKQEKPVENTKKTQSQISAEQDIIDNQILEARKMLTMKKCAIGLLEQNLLGGMQSGRAIEGSRKLLEDQRPG